MRFKSGFIKNQMEFRKNLGDMTDICEMYDVKQD